MGHGLYYVAAYFGTPFFALFACITWYVALSIILHGENWKKGFLFAVFSVITALIRPEGVILSGLMLLTIIYILGLNRSRATIAFFFTLFFFFGGSYFLWRWHYFGYPLPNAFYKKGGWKIHLDGLNNSLLQTLRLCFLIMPAYLLGLYSKKTFRLTIGFAIPLIGFTSAFILLSREMNYGARFQYVLLPMTLMSWWLLLGGMKEYFHFPRWCNYSFKKRVMMSLPIIIVVLGILYYQFRKGSIESFRDGRYDVAVILSEYKSGDYRIATTEAGLLPLYSHWRALDTWGLNDQWIAHQGKMTEKYLNDFKPNVIMFHVGFSPIVASDENSGPWYEMVMIMKSYAEKNNYVLAAAYGDSPYKTHYYYVQQDFPESQEIINRIRSTKYSWYGTGRMSMNYAIYSMNVH